ncbi:hypothetical protein Q5Y75_06630 [Ruegeria sp. 2205SS24-7]|uniref:hypothetical protein n=1 Tax=Ruegeria discodermiae TaxID=3064389 RepID=UPI002741927F|nr:hypothetical protein [Ruegeria sp. 2205SS24-7]MDP5216887.1 hypothetical protein [Ruegeria sp. 2205SS24-7]
MKLTYSSVDSPAWANPQRTKINCFVKFDHIKQKVQFTAEPSVSEPHGKEIYELCASGKFGPVAAFEPKSAVGEDDAVEPERLLFLDRWPEVYRFILEANQESSAGTIRGQILVWSSMIEVLVTRLLESFLIDHKISKKLLHDNKEMNFSTRISLSFGLGLICKDEQRTCDRVRTIRNCAAHNWLIDLPKIQSELRSLYDADHSEILEWQEDINYLVRLVYGGSCAKLANNLTDRTELASRHKRVVLG